MKALVKMRTGSRAGLGRYLALPVVGAGDVLVRVKATGICGTDLHIEAWNDGRKRTGGTAGHRGP